MGISNLTFTFSPAKQVLPSTVEGEAMQAQSGIQPCPTVCPGLGLSFGSLSGVPWKRFKTHPKDLKLKVLEAGGSRSPRPARPLTPLPVLVRLSGHSISVSEAPSQRTWRFPALGPVTTSTLGALPL